jgi:hypothetical protein
MIAKLFEVNDGVRSKRDAKIQGTVIGYGTLQWTSEKSVDEDEAPSLVYLVQIKEEGSSGLGPAVAVLRADQTLARWAEEEK